LDAATATVAGHQSYISDLGLDEAITSDPDLFGARPMVARAQALKLLRQLLDRLATQKADAAKKADSKVKTKDANVAALLKIDPQTHFVQAVAQANDLLKSGGRKTATDRPIDYIGSLTHAADEGYDAQKYTTDTHSKPPKKAGPRRFTKAELSQRKTRPKNVAGPANSQSGQGSQTQQTGKAKGKGKGKSSANGTGKGKGKGQKGQKGSKGQSKGKQGKTGGGKGSSQKGEKGWNGGGKATW
jgi:hypothetical protein